MKILVATSNPSKLSMFRYILKGYKVIDRKSLGLENVRVEETGKNAKENALLKARYFCGKTGLVTLADDAGIEIDALNGEPGYQSKRWGGRFSEDVDDDEWLNYFLKRMENVPMEKRTGKYRACWAVATPDQREFTKEITLEFMLGEKPHLPYMPAWPISALMINIEHKKYFKDLPDEQRFKSLKEQFEEWDILGKVFR